LYIYRWGCSHEKEALDKYVEKTGPKHREFQLCESGLHIHPQYPHLGATPDAMVECECHGKGVVEVKCPYCHRDKTPSEAAMQDKRFFLER